MTTSGKVGIGMMKPSLNRVYMMQVEETAEAPAGTMLEGIPISVTEAGAETSARTETELGRNRLTGTNK